MRRKPFKMRGDRRPLDRSLLDGRFLFTVFTQRSCCPRRHAELAGREQRRRPLAQVALHLQQVNHRKPARSAHEDGVGKLHDHHSAVSQPHERGDGGGQQE